MMRKRAGSGECRRHDARITIHRLLLIGAIALCKFQHGGASEAPSTAPSAASSNISGDVPSNVPEISSYRPSDVATSSQIPTIDSSTLPSQLSSSLVSDAPTLSESLDTSQEPTITSTEMSRDEASWSLIPTLDAIVASSDSPTHQPSLDLSEAPSLLQTGQMSEEPTFETTNLSWSLVPSLEQAVASSAMPTQPSSLDTGEIPSISSTTYTSEFPTTLSSNMPSQDSTINVSEIPTISSLLDITQQPSGSIRAQDQNEQHSNLKPTKGAISDEPSTSVYPLQEESEVSSLTSEAPSISPTTLPSNIPSTMPSGVLSDAPSMSPSKIRAAVDTGFIPIYINTGGDEYIDIDGNTWEADNYFNTGNKFVASAQIDGTENDEILLSERWDPSSGDELVYDIPNIPHGTYDVTLHFSENYVNEAGKRVFNVSINDELVFGSVDIFNEAGGGFKALSKTATVVVTENSMAIKFIHVIENPKISGIEIHEADTDTKMNAPSAFPSNGPSSIGTESPSESSVPSLLPSTEPSGSPSLIPSMNPSALPTPSWIDKEEDENYKARHECSFVQAGDKFYMFGGREFPRQVDTYDFTSNTWSTSASAPKNFNHFQATEYEGLIWVIAAFKHNQFPNEEPEEFIYVFDPAYNVWMKGPEIPANRRRGGGGLVVYQGNFYVIGGNQLGHNGGFVNMFDRYDPRANSWTTLPDAPHARDHFHAAVVEDKLYAIGGRRTTKANTFGDTESEVDVFDFASGEWLGSSSTPDVLPSPRAASAVAVFDGKIFFMGGESASQTTAYDRVDVLDPVTGSWTSFPPLNHGRHGTQAIVSGSGIYIAGGSPLRGGGNMKNMEVFNEDAPEGVTSSQGVLTTTKSLVKMEYGVERSINVQHASGSQGVFVTEISLSGESAEYFTLTSNEIMPPLLIGIGSSIDVSIEYIGSINGANAQLDVTFSGSEVISVALVGWVDSQAPSLSPSSQPSPLPSFMPSASQPTSGGPSFEPVYINCGGEEIVDINGTTWAADKYFNTGNRYVASGSIEGTSNDSLFLSERWDSPSGDELVYSIPVIPSLTYEVTLYFSENYVDEDGKRVFDVALNNEVIFSNLDIFKEAGGGFKALSKTESIIVSVNSLEIKFIHVTENPKISGIKVVPFSGSPSAVPSTMPSQVPSMLPSSAPSPFEPTFDPIYINAGGSSDFTDSNGITWTADEYFNTESTTWLARNTEILDTDDDVLFLSERYSNKHLKYEIPLPDGIYRVRLLAAENYVTGIGQRVFSVSMQNEVVADRIDIFEESGGASRAWNMTTNVTVSDGLLVIQFGRIAQNPKVSGISIHAISGSNTVSSTPTPAESSAPSMMPSLSPSMQPFMNAPAFNPIYINAGGDEYIDIDGHTWEADNYFNTGNKFVASGQIDGTENDEILLSERWDPYSGDELVYDIPNIPPGTYAVTLHFSENYVNEAGKRVFNVSINDELVFGSVDIFNEAGGGFKALSKMATVTVTENSMAIEFIHVIENPKISGIEIHAASSSGAAVFRNQR